MKNAQSKLMLQIPNLGWKQFLIARAEILAAYDNAKIHSEKREVKVRQGIVAEAEFRRWLSNFLPKRYGVTSGYIISQGLPNSEHLIHYDVIIYDQLESPVLWVDGSADSSGLGSYLAIPVEYVCGVIEVKSSLNKKSAQKAVAQLAKLKPLLRQIDPTEQPSKLYLPKNFFCAIVFFELRKEHEMEFSALDELVEGADLRGYYGGYILRGETLDQYSSGRLSLIREEKESVTYNESMLFWANSKSKKLGNGQYFKVLLQYSESHFSEFAFDVIAMLKGTYHPHVMSSMYGFGTTQFENGSASDRTYYKLEDVKKFEETAQGHLKR